MSTVDSNSLSVHWSAVFAGLFVTVLAYFTLMMLGMAVGAESLKDVIVGQQVARSVGFGMGVWTVVSVLFSLFIGSYASGRVSGIIATRIGFTQGAVITSLFMLAMLAQMGATGSLVVRGAGSISLATLTGGGQLASSPRVTAVVEDSLNGLVLKSPPGPVMAGMISRLLRGDTESAKSYLAYQSGISQINAQARVNTMNAKFKSTVNAVAQDAADAASLMGWSSFVTLMLGSLAAMLGGATGAMVNLRKPFDPVDQRALRRRPAYS